MKDLSALRKAVLDKKCLGTLLIEDRHVESIRFEVQLRCPFHGPDNKPSSRYYPDTDSMYCWRCQKKWDVIGYLREKGGHTFSSALDYLAKRFSIDLSLIPDINAKFESLEINKAEVKVDKKYLVLIKLEEKLGALKGTIPFEKYNNLAFGYLLLKTSILNDNFVNRCKLLAEDMKTLG